MIVSQGNDVAKEVMRDAGATVEQIAQRSVETEDDYLSAAEWLRLVRARVRELERERKKLKAPVLEAGRRIDALFRGALERCEQVQDRIESGMRAYVLRVSGAQRAQARAAESELADPWGAASPGSPVVFVPGAVTVPAADGVSVRDRWAWVVRDVSQIPRMYLVPDSSAIGRVVAAHGMAAEQLVPGISVTRDVAFTTRDI